MGAGMQACKQHAACTTIMILMGGLLCAQVLNEVGNDMKAKVRTCDFSTKLHLVDLAGECICLGAGAVL